MSLNPLTLLPSPSRQRTWLRWVLAHKVLVVTVTLGMLLLPYLALCFYNQPYWDDYGNAALARDRGRWASLVHLYLTWTGRYTSGLWLTALNPLTYGWEAGVRWFALALFGATAGVQVLALRTLTRKRLSLGASLAWSGAWLLGQLYTMPSVNSGFYWFASTVTYQVATLLFVLVPVAGLRAGRASGILSKAAWYFVAAVAAIGVAGSNELALMLLLWLLAVLTVGTWRQAETGNRWRWLGLLLITAAAGAVALFAPGNFARMIYEGKAASPGLLRIVARAVTLTVMFLTEPRQLTALLVAPVLLARLGHRTRHWRPAALRAPLPVGLAVVLLGLFGAFLLLSRTWLGYPAVRSLNFLWFWLLSGWLLALWASLPAEPSPAAAHRLRWLAPLRLPALLYVLLLAGGGTERDAWRDWLENAPSWKAQGDARSQAIHTARAQGRRDVVVEGLKDVRPHNVLLLGETLEANPASDLNRAVADWYQVDSVRVRLPFIGGSDVNFH
ncbi:MAG: hypothetical protein JWR44_3823 [Hymenobacter sp.]|nr:hypothetical protein [Hymenobacter sp.]